MPAYALSITEPLRTLSLKALGSVSQVIPGSIPIPLSLAIPVRYLCMYQWVNQHIYDLHPSFHLQEQKEPFLSLQRKKTKKISLFPSTPPSPLLCLTLVCVPEIERKSIENQTYLLPVFEHEALHSSHVHVRSPLERLAAKELAFI